MSPLPPPRPLPAKDVRFPPYQVRTLSNGLQVIAVSHHEQGRLPELERVLNEVADRYPSVPTWPAVLAVLHASAGRPERVRRELDRLSPTDLPNDVNWLLTIVMAAEATATGGQLIVQAPRFAGWLLADAISYAGDRPPVQVAIVGRSDDPARGELVRTAYRAAPAGSVILAGEPDQAGFDLLADRPLIEGRATAYVCQHFVCKLPVTSAADLAAQLAP